MTQLFLNTTITFVLSSVLGYCLNSMKNYKNKLNEKKQKENQVLKEIKRLKETQLLDMRNDLSNKFYVYDALETVEDYLVMSFREKCEAYFELGGDNWIHPMYEKSFKWNIKPTGYLD